MNRLVCEDRRKVAEVERSGILPAEGQYYREIAEYSGIPNNRPVEHERRCAAANRWLTDAVERVRGAEIVLLDPDKRIANGQSRIGANDPLYAFMEEIKAFWAAGHSLVIYHQTSGGRNCAGVRATAARIQEELGVQPITLWFRPGGQTLIFFVIPQEHHRKRIEQSICQMLASPWKSHFEMS